MKKLPIKDRIFWKNFLQCILIFCVAVSLFGIRLDDASGQAHFNFYEGYMYVSILCVLYLFYKIAISFTKEK
jgi:hypothetical protein